MAQTAVTPVLATLFNRSYLNKGLALIESLHWYHPAFELYVLALDDVVEQAVMPEYGQQQVIVVPYKRLETLELRNQLARRNAAERCWSLTPYWTAFVLDGFDIGHITYVDADTFLFAPLDPFYRELRDASIGIVPHRFPPALAWRAQHNGRYNVNFVYFRRDPTGVAALRLWAEQCLDWCSARSEYAADGTLRFGDQAYLDPWVERYGAHELQHKGINLAPWNQEQYRYVFEQQLYVIEEDSAEAGAERVRRIDPLVAYHFHEWQSNGQRTGYRLAPDVLRHIYLPYEHEQAVLGQRTGAQR